MIERLLPWGWFLESSPTLTRKEIFAWWEKRRPTFNFWVGVVGICTWLSVEIAGGLAVKPGADFEEPILISARRGLRSTPQTVAQNRLRVV